MTQRHPSRHRHRGARAAQSRFLHARLGLRLVKKTVNFDDPGTYHLYYGDEAGHPGTILTFFPWEHAAPGRLGRRRDAGDRVPRARRRARLSGRIASSSRASPHEAADEALRRDGVAVQGSGRHAACALSPCRASEDEPAGRRRRAGPSMRSAASTASSLLLEDAAPTGAILTDVLGFDEVGREGDVTRYRAATRPSGGIVDLREAGGFLRRPAWARARCTTSPSAPRTMRRRRRWCKKLAENHGIRTTEQKDRNYFRSVYFREPGGSAVRDRDRRAGLRGRRAGRHARRGAEAAAFPREASRARSRRCCPSRLSANKVA